MSILIPHRNECAEKLLAPPSSAGGENNFIYKFLYLHPRNPHPSIRPVHAELILNHQSFNTWPGCITAVSLSLFYHRVYNSPILQIPHEKCKRSAIIIQASFEHDNSPCFCCWIRRRRVWKVVVVETRDGIDDEVPGIELLSGRNINWC